MKIYFDNAATTKLHPQVLEAMLPYFTKNFGNPSSVHSFGNKARVAIETAREIIADFINADPSEIYFTSGGSEANNFCIKAIALTEYKESERKSIVTTKIEHPSVLNTFKDLEAGKFQVCYLKTDKNFNLNYRLIKNFSATVSLISIMHINNETGNINDIRKIKSEIEKNIFFHTDAVQSFGKIKIDVKELNIDALSASAHKIYGPKGIGFAYVKNGTPMQPLILGGAQERNRRAGTENVAAIVGFAEAVKLAKINIKENYKTVFNIKNYFIERLNKKISGISFNHPINQSLNQSANQSFIHSSNQSSVTSSPYILNFTFSPKYFNVDKEAMLMFLDINGIAASGGSACSSGTVKPSYVILASGKSADYAKGTLRFSFSPDNTFEEVDYTISILEKIAEKYRKKKID